jgi:methanogenic corrinoid protein MtbC1
MNAEAKQASQIIDSTAKAIANWTVEQHAQMAPHLPDRYGTNWRADWVGHALSQVHLLAQAVAVRSSALFAHSIRWHFESFKARGVDPTDLLQNLNCLKGVLAAELPPPVARETVEIVADAIKSLDSPMGDVEAEPVDASEMRTPVLKYLEAILEGNRAAAESIILTEQQAGASVAAIYEQILAPAQQRLGWMWHRGEISVADEHFGSATTQSVMSQLRPYFQRLPIKGRSVVATSTPGDLHEIGLRMVADLFEIDGWHVTFLGANTPIADVVELLERRRFDLLALSVSTALTLRDAGELIEAIRGTSATASTKVLVGGPPFRVVHDISHELGADGCALSAVEAVAAGNRLVGGSNG